MASSSSSSSSSHEPSLASTARPAGAGAGAGTAAGGALPAGGVAGVTLGRSVLGLTQPLYKVGPPTVDELPEELRERYETYRNRASRNHPLVSAARSARGALVRARSRVRAHAQIDPNRKALRTSSTPP